MNQEDPLSNDRAPPIALIDLLSDDLLYEVFNHCYPASLLRSSSSPVIVSQVCQRWRQLSLSCGRFWAYVSLTKKRPNWERLETWIRRSGDAPLRITFLKDAFMEKSVPVIRQILQLVIPHTHRWRLLFIQEVPQKIVQIILDRMRHRKFPILRTVRASDYFVIELSKIDPSFQPTGIQLCPSLLAQPPIAYANLVILRILVKNFYSWKPKDAFFVKETLSVLQGAPKLRCLEIGGLSHYRESMGRKTAININPCFKHGSLQILELHESSVTDEVLASFALPHLRHLPQGYSIPSPLLHQIKPNKAWRRLKGVILDRFCTTPPRDAVEPSAPEPGDLNSDVEAISRLPLRKLRLIGYHFDESFTLSTLVERLPVLLSLELWECVGFTSDNVKDLVSTKKCRLMRLLVEGGAAKKPCSKEDTFWIRQRLPAGFIWTHKTIGHYFSHRKPAVYWDSLTRGEWWFPA